MSKQIVLDALRDVATHLTSATTATDIDTMRASVLAAKDNLAVATQAALDYPPADNGTRIVEEQVAALPTEPESSTPDDQPKGDPSGDTPETPEA